MSDMKRIMLDNAYNTTYVELFPEGDESFLVLTVYDKELCVYGEEVDISKDNARILSQFLADNLGG